MGPTKYTRFLIAFKIIIHICFHNIASQPGRPQGTGGFLEAALAAELITAGKFSVSSRLKIVVVDSELTLF